jgi:crotonobetaine/carnitine-CoA ligase
MAGEAPRYGLIPGGGDPEGRYALAFAREDRSMLRVLRERSRDRPNHPWLQCEAGSLTFGEASQLVNRVGHAVVRDVGPGAHVALLLRNQIEFMPAFYGAHAANGVVVPLNAELRGSHLAHAIDASHAAIVVVRDELLPRLDALDDLGEVRVVVVVGDDDRHGTMIGEVPVVGWASWLDGTSDEPPLGLPAWTDTAVIQFTSGTTGRAKGVVFPHHYLYMASAVVADSLDRRPDDVLYTPMPVFHVGGLHFVPNSALHAGCTAVLRQRFSPAGFWDEVVECGANFAIILAPMLALVNKLGDDIPPHRLETIFCVPRPPDLEGFEQRSGVRVLWQGYGMTEVHPLPGRRDLLPDRPSGTLGMPVTWIDFGVVDEHDNLLGPGEVGELVFRSNLPHAMFREYYEDPAATVHAFRNFMFHTGDLASYDADGVLRFMGRTQDRIRRRGEMVGAMEVELGVLAHPDVLEAAAYAVPSPLGEDDIKLDVVARPGLTMDALAAWCEQNLPRYMVPRYYEPRDAFPKTPSERIEKYKLVVADLDRPDVFDVERER